MLIIIYLLLPWIKIGGYPAVFLDIVHRRLHLFGFVITPQELWILFFAFTGLGFSLFFISALFGRIWCGWLCPHTVFLDHIYRRVERLLEGDAIKRKQLDRQAWNAEKVLRRGSKHLIFVLISALITHLFLAYFISIPELYRWVQDKPTEHWGAFVFVFVFTGILYFNFSWFREQLCLVICPYGRLQSALVDEDSLVIGYDQQRGGDPSGTLQDCVGCQRCIQVCPTGIDIRQGLQIECIGCAACIDACDAIMDKVGKPRGLIRYDSLNGLEQKPRRWLRPRIFLYCLLMLLGLTALTVSLKLRLKPVDASVVRMTGIPYVVKEGVIRNQYMLKIEHKHNREDVYELAIDSPVPLEVKGLNQTMTLDALQETSSPLILMLDEQRFYGPFSVRLILKDTEGKVLLEKPFDFIGPAKADLSAERE